MNQNKLKLLILIIFFTTPRIIIAQPDFSHFLPSAQSIGMGGSAVALSHDPSAGYWNPATISFLTTNRVLINVNSQSYLNYIGLTKFFPPSLGVGINLLRSQVDENHYDMATFSLSYRFFSFLSLGSNFNLSKTMDDEVYSSFGVGFFFKSMPDYRITSAPSNTLWNWLRSKKMYDKFNFGIALHNYALMDRSEQHELRIGASVKPTNLGPLIHFAYHRTPDDYSLHLGTAAHLSRHSDLFFGISDLDINNFIVGSAIEVGAFEFDVSYDLKHSKIHFSLLLRLSEGKNASFRKYRDSGNQQIKNNDFKNAFKSYLKAFVFEPQNEEISYLISVLQKESDQTKHYTDSLFAVGQGFEKRGWYITAFTTYQRILESDPTNRKALRSLKGLNSKLEPYLNQLFRRGVAYFEEPNLDRAGLLFNHILLVNKNHEGAKVYLAKIDSINSNAADEYFYRGLGYFQQKNLSRAKQEFKEALTYNPDHAQAKEYLERTESEIETTNQLIERYMREAKSYEQSKQFVKATLSYRKILDIDKTHQYAKDRLTYLNNHISSEIDEKFRSAKLRYDQMDYSGAITLFQDILTIDPNHAASKRYLRRANQKLLDLAQQHYERAQNFFNQRKWDIVLQECILTLEMNPDHSAAKELKQMALSNISLDKLIDKGMGFYRRGDYLNARSTFRQVLQKEPSNSTAQSYLMRIENELNMRIEELFNMGLEKYAEGDYADAINEWNKILAIDPAHESAKRYIQNAQERIDALKQIER